MATEGRTWVKRAPGYGEKLEVEYQIGDGPIVRTKTTNFSEGGAFILSDEPPIDGTQLTVVIKLGRTESVTVKSEVRWVSRYRHLPGMGVKFHNLADADFQRIKRHYDLRDSQ
jgi:hypothetical protein